MTNEIEKKFFDAFGIKAKRVRPFYCNKNLKNRPCEFCIEEHGKCLSQKEIFPEITNRILFKLICLLVAHYWKTKEHYYLTALDDEHLRKEILSDACYVIDGMFAREKEADFINQVRALFREKEEK